MSIRSTALSAPVFRPEKFDKDNRPPPELAEFIRPVWECADCYPRLCRCREATDAIPGAVSAPKKEEA